MQNVTVEAQTRERLTNGKLKAARKEGWIPAILYGAELKGPGKKGAPQSVLLNVPEKPFLKMVGHNKRSNAIVQLKWGSETANVVIKEIQTDVISQKLLHIDFQKISMTEKLEVLIPIHIVGEAPGVKLHGGILEVITREIRVRSLPKDIPGVINVDISGVDIGKGLSVKDIPALPGVEVLSDPHQLLVTVVAPTELEEAPAAEAAVGTAEPEVIAKGKKPEEGEAAAGTAAAPKAGAAAPAPAAKDKGPAK